MFKKLTLFVIFIEICESSENLSLGAEIHIFLLKLIGKYKSAPKQTPASKQTPLPFEEKFTSGPVPQYSYSGPIKSRPRNLYVSNVPFEMLVPKEEPIKSYSYTLYPIFSNKSHVFMDTTTSRSTKIQSVCAWC